MQQSMSPKAARRRMRLTVAQVAAATGINKSTVSRIERGIVRPLHETVEALESLYGVSLKIRRAA